MFELTFLIVVAQLTDSYIRWLAFSSKTGEEIKLKLWKSYFLWGLASFFLYSLIFATFSINATTYKAILMLGWLPYFLLEVKFIKFGLPQHVFVIGMGTICSLLQHTICAIIILKFLTFASDEEIILTEAAGYLLLFSIFLPIFRRYFIKLLASRELFDLRPRNFAAGNSFGAFDTACGRRIGALVGGKIIANLFAADIFLFLQVYLDCDEEFLRHAEIGAQ